MVTSALILSACVSQQSALNLNTSPQPSASLSIAPQNTASAGEQTLASSLDAETGEQTTIAIPRPSPSVSLNSAPANSSTSSSATSTLAIADPTPAAVPAQTVIAGATSSTTPQPTTDVSQASTTQNAATQVPTTQVASAQTTTTQTTAPQTASSQAKLVQTPTAPSDNGQTPSTDQNVTLAAVTPDAATVPQAEPTQPQATGLFARLFQPRDKKSNPRPRKSVQRSNGRDGDSVRIAAAHERGAVRPKPVRNTTVKRTRVVARSRSEQNGQLPGVKSNSQIFGIDTQNDNRANERVSPETRLASVGGLGLLSPNGLRVQHDKVQVACLKPGVLRILKTVERRYGKKPIITSGYRSPNRNRRAGGAKNSQHIYCKAVDIQVEGVSKWNLAKYLRTIPGRGGVGTYCRTNSVHIDIGSKRDWHHPCRRSSKRKKKKA